MSIVVVALLAVAAGAVPRTSAPAATPAAALPPAALAGRLVLRDGSRTLTPRDARKALAGKALTLQLRSGWKVVSARLDDDGFFVAEGDPGDWVIEHVSAGDLVEFVDPPMTLRARGGELACAGQIELTFRDLGAELGQGTGRAAASDRCGELQPRLQGAARGRTVRTRLAEPAVLPVKRSAWELEDAVRAGLYFRSGDGDGGSETHLSATGVVGVNRAAGTSGAVVAGASFVQTDLERGRARRTVSAGVGYWLGSLVEVSAGPELQLSGAEGSGVGVFGQLRLGPPAFGLGVRVERGRPGGILSYGLDVAPLAVLGALL